MAFRMSSAQLRVLIICFIAQNFAIGITFGSLGPMLLSTEHSFGIGRAAAVLCISFSSLALGLSSPLTGMWMQRIPTRDAMMLGAGLDGLAFLGHSIEPSFGIAIVLYIVSAVGAGLFGLLGTPTMISQWFPTNRGKALAFVNMPVLMTAMPFIILGVHHFSRAAIMQGLGIALLLMIPLLFIVPRRSAVRATGTSIAAARDSDSAVISAGVIFSTPYFWLISVSIGILVTAGSIFVIHAIPFGLERGLSLRQASGMLSVESAVGVGGVLIVGWLLDRFGAARTIAFVSFSQAVLWWLTLHLGGNWLLLIAGLLGIGISSAVTMHAAALAALFGPANVSRAIGCSYLIKAPLLFAGPPLVALLVTATHGYGVPILLIAAAVALAGVLGLGPKTAHRLVPGSRIPDLPVGLAHPEGVPR